MSYLMIENRGVASYDLLTIVGASTSRDDDVMIGRYGSGAKYGIAVCLRRNLDVKVYNGRDGFEYGIEERFTKDVRGNEVVIQEVVMRRVAGSGSKKTKHLGFDVGFGSNDWHCPTMAVREFISNAADASMALVNDYSAMKIEIVEDNQVRAKDGHTRFFIQLNNEIRQYYNKLTKYFLIFKPDFNVNNSVLIKESSDDNLRIYRKGVLVGELDYKSLFDYNLNDVDMKESREVSEYSAGNCAVQAIKNGSLDVIIEFLTAVRDDVSVWETKEVSTHNYINYVNSESRDKKWKQAINVVFGDTAVVCESDYVAERVRRKGHTPYCINDSYLRMMLTGYGVKSASDVLSANEIQGREEFELNDSQKQMVNKVWSLLVELGVTKGRACPRVVGYHDVMDAGSNTLGTYDFINDLVGLSKDVLDSGFEFVKTLVEEFSHAISGAGDESRDMQDFAFRVTAKLVLEKLGD